MLKPTLLLLLAGCQAPEALPTVQVELSPEVATVLTARWETEAPTAGRIEYGTSLDYGQFTPMSAVDSAHALPLLGIGPEEEVHLRLVLDDGRVGEDVVSATGSLPGELPRLISSGLAGGRGGYTLVPLMGTISAFLILDEAGRVVWYRQLDPDYVAIRGHIAVDGSGVVVAQAATHDHELSPDAHALRISWDGQTEEAVSIPDLAHDLLQLPDGTLAALCVDAEEGYTALGDRITEVTLDGTLSTIWRAWDTIDPTQVGTENLEEESWTHANALSYDPATDSYLVSLRALSSVISVGRSTGAIQWGLGGELEDFSWTEGAEPLAEQHEAIATEAGVLVFDNGTAERGWSRVVEIALDQEAGTATPVWEHRHDPDLFIYAKGGVQRLDDGSTRVGWSTAGRVQEIDPAGEIAWQLDASMGAAVVFPQWVPSLTSP